MRNNQSYLDAQQTVLPLNRDKPILDCLVPVRIEHWREEGLFKRGRHSVSAKMRFCMHIRAAAFDFSPKAFLEMRQESSAASRQEVMADKKIQAIRKFNVIRDPFMREVMSHMIVAEHLLRARYIAEKLQIRWAQFVIDFNAALDDMMDAQGL